MRIKIFNEIAVTSDDSLDPGPELQAGLRHGVPVKGARHPLHLLDQALDFVLRLCIDL